jgi:hypothetical protein
MHTSQLLWEDGLQYDIQKDNVRSGVKGIMLPQI